jgi:hypothetical protein
VISTSAKLTRRARFFFMAMVSSSVSVLPGSSGAIFFFRPVRCRSGECYFLNSILRVWDPYSQRRRYAGFCAGNDYLMPSFKISPIQIWQNYYITTSPANSHQSKYITYYISLHLMSLQFMLLNFRCEYRASWASDPFFFFSLSLSQYLHKNNSLQKGSNLLKKNVFFFCNSLPNII